jgi:choline transporter-like protein 2/4/5
MPSIVFFPILPFIMVVGLVVYWVAVTAVLYSAGDATPNYRNANSYTPFTFKDLALAVRRPPAGLPSPAGPGADGPVREPCGEAGVPIQSRQSSY